MLHLCPPFAQKIGGRANDGLIGEPPKSEDFFWKSLDHVPLHPCRPTSYKMFPEDFIPKLAEASRKMRGIQIMRDSVSVK